jgi:hypothetical protein
LSHYPQEERPGIFYHRVTGANVGVTYVLDLDRKSIAVALIG